MNDLLPQIDMIKVIGSGTFGVVLEAEYRHSKKKCALKRIHKIGTQMSRQVEILYKIKNAQNVIHMEHIFYTKDDFGQNLLQNIVFEYVQSNLQSLIQSNIRSKTQIPQNCIKKYSYQLLNGLSQIHSLHITHRDLKPQNILLSQQGIIKICDFGSSKILSEQGQNTPYIVSRYYRAPQLIFCITKYTSAIDIWAAACIIAELYLLTPLFKGKSQSQQIFAIAQRLGRMNQHEFKYFKKLIPFEPSNLKFFNKYSKQSFENDFYMSNDQSNLIDLLEKMLKYNPQDRISAKQALNHPYFDQVRGQFVKSRK